METAVINIDEELQEYISLLDIVQKKSLLELIKSFAKKEEMNFENMKEQTVKLAESKTNYQTKTLMTGETEAEEANGWIGKPQTIEEYNQELEEAVDEIKRGEFYTHDEVVEMLNQRRWKKE